LRRRSLIETNSEQEDVAALPPLTGHVGTSFQRILEARRPKAFRRGTHRVMAPEETLARVRSHAAAMGITRLGNITGLDRIGIPVAVAVRPNSRSVSVSQGKGLDLPQAMASALMEACEGFHAEEVKPTRFFSYRAFATIENVADPAKLCAGPVPFDPEKPIAWTPGYDLLRREQCWVPYKVVHTDYTQRASEDFFLASSNGLASGNDLVEAINAALFELVERDAVALWGATAPEQRRPLDLASVDDADCGTLLDRYRAAGIAIGVWHVTSDSGIPAFLCEIRDPAPADPARLRRFHGSGCHADRGVALARALTEAAQTRLTYIAGIRDDLAPTEYIETQKGEIEQALLDALASEATPVAFGAVPGYASDDLADDLRWALARLAACGIEQAIAIDLSRPELAIPVMRVVVPGLEGHVRHPDYRPGPRAQAMAGL
jgi:YcaO-like protein with predicted kinase domain